MFHLAMHESCDFLMIFWWFAPRIINTIWLTDNLDPLHTIFVSQKVLERQL